MRLVFLFFLLAGLGLSGFAVYTAQGRFSAYQTALSDTQQRVVPTRDVYVAARQLRYGEALAPEDVTAVAWPEASVPEGAFAALDEIFPEGAEGARTVLRVVEAGEPLLPVKLTEPGNALLAIRAQAPDLPIFKLSSSSSENRARMRTANIQLCDARRARFPDKGCVVAGTCFQLAKLHEREQFHYSVFDEAGQLPIPHALPGMLRAQRWLFFGDHQQLPPVVTTADADRGAAISIFEHLHELYGSSLLDTTYRMNDGVCRLISETFYGDQLHSAEVAAARRMPFVAGGRLDEVLHPDASVVWLRVGHRQPGQRSTEEANAVADVVEDLVRRHGVPAKEIAIIAPFRAQVRLMRSAIERKLLTGFEELTIDTVERIQGQEREVVVLSLTAGDPAVSKRGPAFHLSLNRLNVALSRARTKAILVGSSHAFRALPADAEGLRMASRCKELRDRMTCGDLSSLYVISGPS